MKIQTATGCVVPTVAVAAALVLAGCTGVTPADKAGGATVVLEFASIDGSSDEAFLTALDELAGGELQVQLATTYGDGAAEAESNLIEAIASGELDGGWPSVRAFARAGIPVFKVLEAPMTITSIAAEKELVSGPIAEELLSRLEGTGIVGLGLTVGPLRRPFVKGEPLLGPEDWQGARFRSYNSVVQDEAIRALGGEPVNLSFSWLDEMGAGNLRGSEFDIGQYWANGAVGVAESVTTNVVLWPKVNVLSLSQKRFDSLTEEQRGWIAEAADRAVKASIERDYDESEQAKKLCQQGVRFLDAQPEHIAALRGRLAPVIEGLATTAEDKAVLADIQQLGERHPGPEELDIPADCRTISPEKEEAAPVPEETSELPEGVYRVDIALDDVTAMGASNGPGWTGTWTLEIKDGTYALSCRPLDLPGKDCGNVTFNDDFTFDTVLDAGFVRGTGDTVYFVYDAGVHSDLTGCEPPCFPLPTYSLKWAADGDSLTFSHTGDGLIVEKVIKPWRKVS